MIGGRFGLRACITNVRTEAPDVERLLAVAAELGERERQAIAGASGSRASAASSSASENSGSSRRPAR